MAVSCWSSWNDRAGNLVEHKKDVVILFKLALNLSGNSGGLDPAALHADMRNSVLIPPKARDDVIYEELTTVLGSFLKRESSFAIDIRNECTKEEPGGMIGTRQHSEYVLHEK